MLARVPSGAVPVASAYSSPSLCTAIYKNIFTSFPVLKCHTLNGLFMLHTVWPGVPVNAVVGATLKHLNSVPQYLEKIIIIVNVKVITIFYLSLVSIAGVTVPPTGESH